MTAVGVVVAVTEFRSVRHSICSSSYTSVVHGKSEALNELVTQDSKYGAVL